MSAEIVIVECGLVTPVGLSARETFASTRARTARLTEIEWRDSRFEPFIVGILPEDTLPPLHPELIRQPLQYREGRMLRLAQRALQEAVKPLSLGFAPPPLFLGLPELHTQVPVEPGPLMSRLALQSSVALDLANSVAFSAGRASALLALQAACSRLRQGDTPFAIVGGIDSQVDLYVLGTLDLQKRVRNSVNPDGFAPAEGAGFLLLTHKQEALRRGLRIRAQVLGESVTKEEGHLYSEKPYRGEGLASCFEQLLGKVPPDPKIGCVYSSFNGEHYWAKEFGVAMLRHREHFAENHRMEHPAECFGDLGAAHGAVLLSLGALMTEKAGLNSKVMVYVSSDFGTRSAALLTNDF